MATEEEEEEDQRKRMNRSTLNRLICVAPLLGLLACEDSSGTNSASNAASGVSVSASSSAGGSAAATTGSGGTGGSGGAAETGDIYVDSALGMDLNEGSFSHPYKTIKHAVESWSPGRAVVLMAGYYAAASGESWGYQLPDGITIKANSVGVTLLGTPGATGFNSTATTSFEYLTFKGFESVLSASSGLATFRGVVFDGNTTALALTGNAAASVVEYSAATGAGDVARVGDSASLSADAFSIDEASGYATFRAEQSGSLTLTNIVGKNSSASLVHISQAGSLAMSNVSAQNVGQNNVVDIQTSGTVKIDLIQIYEAPRDGLELEGGDISVTYANITNCGNEGVVVYGGAVKLDHPSIYNCVNGAISGHAGSLEVTNGTIGQPNLPGTAECLMAGGSVRLRGTKISDCYRGIYSGGPPPDLGSTADPGGNVFQNNGTSLFVAGAGTIAARGNTWMPSLQGADSQGHYSAQTISGPVTGKNFTLLPGVMLQL